MKKIITVVKWGKGFGNHNSLLRPDVPIQIIEGYRRDGYHVYDATYRPGFYSTRKEYESNPGVTLLYKPKRG